MEVPNVKRKDFQLIGMEDDFLSLMDDTFHQLGPLGRVGLIVAMCVFVMSLGEKCWKEMVSELNIFVRKGPKIAT